MDSRSEIDITTIEEVYLRENGINTDDMNTRVEKIKGMPELELMGKTKRLEEARRVFVFGDEIIGFSPKEVGNPTLIEIANFFKINKSVVYKEAKERDWEAQRIVHRAVMVFDEKKKSLTNAERRTSSLLVRIRSLIDKIISGIEKEYSELDETGRPIRVASIKELETLLRFEMTLMGRAELTKEIKVSLSSKPSTCTFEELQEIKQKMKRSVEEEIEDEFD